MAIAIAWGTSWARLITPILWHWRWRHRGWRGKHEYRWPWRHAHHGWWELVFTRSCCTCVTSNNTTCDSCSRCCLQLLRLPNSLEQHWCSCWQQRHWGWHRVNDLWTRAVAVARLWWWALVINMVTTCCHIR